MNSSHSIEIITIYDNIPNDSKFKSDWGFGCIINHPEMRILFDTGANPEILEANLNAANIPVSSIDAVIISHKHDDHLGGSSWIVDKNPNMTVYVPNTLSKHLNQLRSLSSNIITVKNIISIDSKCCIHLITTKSLLIKELSLAINTPKGIILVSGCSHSGIDKIVHTTQKHTGQNIHALFGGLHLLNASSRNISKISQSLKNMHVDKIAPCHCTGEKALTILKNDFGNNFLQNGVGMKFNLK